MMFEKMLSFVCCCFPTRTPVRASSSSRTATKSKCFTPCKPKTAFTISCPVPTSFHLSPPTIPCTPTTANSSQHPFCDESTMTSIEDASTFTIDTSSHQISNGASRISAIRELIETEQRYVKDLRTVANEFIKPLSNDRILNDYEIEQLFSNWFNLIACNTVFLSTLEEQVHYREHLLVSEADVLVRTPRSVSMSNLALAAQAPITHSPPTRRSNYRTEAYPHHRRRRRSPAMDSLITKRTISIERLDDNIVPQSSHPSSSMTVNESTRIGDILCSYLPYMSDAYFQYCNDRSQANKYLQTKVDLNKRFRSYLKVFQTKTGGLSLNGFLTKPIQRVTRYPLLVEKILKHTLIGHPDYQAVQQAYECARQINEQINKQISEQENSLRLDWLQQHVLFEGPDQTSVGGYLMDELFQFNSITKYHVHRQLLLHGFITKAQSGKELLAFLCNDFLLLTTIKSSSSNWQSQLFEPKSGLQLKFYRLFIFLTDTFIANETFNDQFTFSLFVKTDKKPVVLKTQQSNVRTLWVRAINNAIEECRAAEKLLLSDKASFISRDDDYDLRSPIAGLVIVVQEAHNLVPSAVTLERHRVMNPYCEVTVGRLTLKTPAMKRTNNPKWNTSMQFLLYDFVDDLIHINIYDHESFSPHQNIDTTSLSLIDILPCSLETFLAQSSHAFNQTIYLNNGASLTVKCSLEFL